MITTGSSLAQTGEDVKIEYPSRTAIRVEFRPMFLTQEVRSRTGEPLTFLTFRGALLPKGTTGAIMVPYMAVRLKLAGREHSLSILQHSTREVRGLRPAAFPSHETDPQFGIATVFDATSDKNETFSMPVATIADVSESDGEIIATLQLWPVQYPSPGTARLSDAIVLTINTEGGGAVASSKPRQIRKKTDSPFATGEWYSIEIQETGIYKLDQTFFTQSNIPISSLSDIQSLRVFGNGGESIPEDLLAPRIDGLQEIPRLIVDNNGNGVFDADDYALFYGRSARTWKYAPGTRTYNHTINPYTESNKYFLTFGGAPGKAMDSLASVQGPALFEAPDFAGLVFVEEERNNLLKSGRQWYGQLFDDETKSGTYSSLLPGFVATAPTSYRASVLARSPAAGFFHVFENGVELGSPIVTFPVNVNSIEVDYAWVAPVATFSRVGPLPDNRSNFRVTFENNGSGARGWVDWIEIEYRRSFEAVGDLLMFTGPDTTATVRYTVTNLTSRNVKIFDVTNHASVTRVTDLSFDPLDPGRCSFQADETSGGVHSYIVLGPNGTKSPGSATKITNSDVHGISAGADFVIVTPRLLLAEAERLAAHREQHDTLTVRVITMEDIFNEFGGGLRDPMALRDFLVWARATWTVTPRYVLLFGNGHYDFKNIRSQMVNGIPPYESRESINQIDTYASDDLFGILQPGNNRVSVALGRIPVRTPEEASVVVNKIIGYETTAAFDPWRNRVTFVADDGLTSTKDDGFIHTNQAEVLAQVYTPASIEKKKIYIVEFPTVNSSAGRRKPAANVAVVDAMNTGSVLVNYTGHGNPQLWAHESIFTRETSLPLLTNKDKLFFLVAATCDFARYDDPAEKSAGEQLLTMEGGGSSGVVTSSRIVYSFENSEFNNRFYTNLFARDSLGRTARTGDAMFATKQLLFGTNDVKYHLFGDPTMRLNFPPTAVSIDSINGSTTASVTVIKALSRAEVAGEITRDGARWTAFNGQGVIEAFDSKRSVPVAEWPGFSFEVGGSLLYRGLMSVTGGVFRATIPIPKDVSYDNDRARLSVYAWTGTADAVGFSPQVVISGTDSLAAVDTTGPQVEVFLEDEAFRSGDAVQQNPLLLVRLFDENGINTSTASVGHRLEAILHASSQAIDLTASYRGDADTYQSGEARYQLRDLSSGRQTLTVKAWDIYNNSSQTDVSFDVHETTDGSLYQVFNFPNPISRSTVFTFQRASVDPVDVIIRIYTVAGRLLRELKVPSVVDRFMQIPWDTRDQNGDQLANGIYFYKVIANSQSHAPSHEVLGKLAIVR